jgi:hypothetical protein
MKYQMYYGIGLPCCYHHVREEERWLTKNERQEGYACFFLCFTYWVSVECTSHDRFQDWRSAGLFKRMWIDGLSVYDKKTGIEWKWQTMDDVITKAPLGNKVQVQIPQTELNLALSEVWAVDGKGVPLSITVDAANRHDMKMTKTL